MSITVSDGSAQAIEYGISTEVTFRPSVAAAPAGPRPEETPRVSRRNDLAGQAEIDVLAGDLDLGEVFVTGARKSRHDRLHELFRRRSPGRETNRGVAVEQVAVEIALAVDQHRGRTPQPGHLHEPLGFRARLRPDHEDERCALRNHFLDRV